jgi:alpha-tubulin suppressor-like RCC1 family protein
MSTLLLVDSSVAGYQKIVAAAKEGVTVVIFDGKTDTYASLLRTASSGPSVFKTVGIVQHGSSYSSTYQLLDTEKPALLSDASGSSWTDLIRFFNTLKKVYSVEIIDLISCSLLANPQWVTALNQLETRTGLNFRASTDATGNIANGGNWVQESDGVNIQDVYFTDAISQYMDLLVLTFNYRRNNLMVDAVSNTLQFPMVSASNPVNGMTTVSTPCSIVTWGNSFYGGTHSGNITDVIAIAATNLAFAAIKKDRSVVVWGDAGSGGSTAVPGPDVSGQLVNVVAIAAAGSAFAALKLDKTVVTWGFSIGGGNSSSVTLTQVDAIAASANAFAALKQNGSVVAWGLSGFGGSTTTPVNVSAQLLSGVTAIASNLYAFAALKSTGSVVTWGDLTYGGNSAGVDFTSGVKAITATSGAFAALKNDNTVVTWGGTLFGGNTTNPVNVSGQLTGVVAIASNQASFAALKSNGTVITWGDPAYGGDSSSVSLINIRAIASTSGAYAAIKTDGSVKVWGDILKGGDNNTGVNISSNVRSIASSRDAFSAIKTDGSVVAWGYINVNPIDISAAQAQLNHVTDIITTPGAFAAIKQNTSVVTYGNSSVGGDSSSVFSQLRSGIINIAPNDYAFAAFKFLVTNTFPVIVGPYITISNVLAYTQEAMNALVAGDPLPDSSRVSWAPLGVPAGTLLRDLRRLVVVKVSLTNPLHASRFQRIQLIRGPTTEGVGGSPADTDAWQTGYICVWAASGSPPIYD